LALARHKKRWEVVLARHTEVTASRSELLSLHCPRHLLLLALLPACADSQVIMRQETSAYAEEPLRTVGLLEAAHQYSLQDVCGSANTPTPPFSPYSGATVEEPELGSITTGHPNSETSTTLLQDRWWVGQMDKKLFTLLDLCVSSLRRGHANLLCIVPILTDDPRRESMRTSTSREGAFK
jgi:hypothetical protein